MGKRVGTAKWLENQKRWQIKVMKDGERRTFTSSTPGRNGQREANRKADAWLDDNIDNTTGRVSDLFEIYMDDMRLKAGVSHCRNAQSVYDTWIGPFYGNKKISAVTEQDIQRTINKAQSMGRSRKTQQNIMGTQTSFIKFCRLNRWTALMPENVKVPDSARLRGKTILQPHDIIILFNTDTITERGKVKQEPYIYAYRFAVLSGMRPGELIGLEWADVKANYLDIKRSININGEETKGKNENALRRHWLTDMEKQVLDEQRKLLPPSENKRVFGILNTRHFWRRLRKFAAQHGMAKTSVYELRHTFVSIAQSELPEGVLKSVVGHSKNMDTYGIYAHEYTGHGQEMANKVAETFEKVVFGNKNQ